MLIPSWIIDKWYIQTGTVQIISDRSADLYCTTDIICLLVHDIFSIFVALGDGTAYGEYIVYEEANDVSGAVKISGTIRYDLYGTSLDIPFVYYPTGDQQGKFMP